MILAIVSLCHEDYVPEHWHVYLVYFALVWAAIGMNVFGARLIPAYNEFMSKITCLLVLSQSLIDKISVLFYRHIARHLHHLTSMRRSQLRVGRLGILTDDEFYRLGQ